MGNLVFPCFFFGFMCLVIFITYLDYRGREKLKSSWRTLAAANRLTFAPGNLFDGGAYVFGTYRGHYLKLETFPKSQGKHNQTYTHLTMSVNNGPGGHFLPTSQDILNEQITVKEVVGLFTAINLPYPLKGRVNAGANGQTVYYEQPGLENDIKYLQALFDLLSDLADAYTAVIILGGEAVPALHEIATDNNHVLREIASHLLYCIGRETTARLRDQAHHLLCPHCLVYCHPHKVRLNWWRSVTYYGCRVCGQSRRFLEGRVVAVLALGLHGTLKTA